MNIVRSSAGTKLVLTALAAVLLALGAGGAAWAQATNPTPQTLPYAQDFSALAHTSTSYPAGWQGWQLATTASATFRTTTPTANRALVASGTAASTTGEVYNYDSQVGFLNTGSLDLSMVLSLNTQLRSSVTVNYDIGTLRNPHDGSGNTRINEVTLQYRIGTLGAFTNLPGVLYQNNTTTQTSGTTLQNVSAKSVTLPSVCDNQNVVQIRWVSREVSGAGSRPSFAVDNISITATTLPPLPDLLARWALDGNINDTSGNGLASGSTTAGPAFVTGIVGTQALSLNGTTQYATVPHDYRLNTPGQITLAAWIRPNVAATQSVISKSINGSIDGYELTLQTGVGGKPFVRFNQATSADTYRLNATTAYPTNGTTWMHVAATYDGATARIYVNGVLDASAAMAVPSIATNGNPAGIGSQYDGSGTRFFNGAIDDARVYSRALTLSEIQALASHTLTYTAGPNGSISGTTPQTVPHGGSGTAVNAVADPGYHFTTWSDGVLTAARTETNVMADLTVTASFAPDAPSSSSTVNVGAAPGLITLANPVQTVPVTISRTDLTSMRAFSVTFSVSSSLNVQGGTGGLHEGTYLSAVNPNTSFNVIDKGVDGFGNHSYQADGTILGTPCGATAANGTLFTIDLASAAAGGSGTVTITSLKLRDCSNADLPNVIGTSSTLSIDQSAPAVQVTAPNGAELWRVGAVENITWTGSDAEGIASYDLAYSTDGGTSYPNAIATVPGTQTSYAWTIPAAPGTMVRVRATALDVNGNSAADASDANFTIAYYTLNYLAGPNGTISGTTPQSVAHGGSGTAVTAVPDPGYHFTSWSDGVLTATRTDSNVTADLTVMASFAINTYTLTYNAGPNGSISGTTPQIVNHGASGTPVTAVPDPGYHFTSWSDGVLTATRTDTNVMADLTVTASFAINTYTLTYNAGPNGSISGITPQIVNHGGSGTPVTAVADPGYHFTSWSDGVLTAARTDTNVMADLTVTATFVVNPPVDPVASLVATQVTPGTLDEQTTAIQLTWDATPPGVTVEVWRKGFGSYPEYDDAGGAGPTASATYPPGAGWVKVDGLDTPGETDLVAARDFYYYVAYAQDGFGTWSPASSLTAGTLNYHLGDVSNGLAAGTGNNKVFSEDISLLGAHYGKTGALVAPVNYLDVGPTTNMFVDGRPATDDRIDFEDLVMFAINYGLGHTGPGPMAALPVSGSVVTANEIALDAPGRVTAGSTAEVRLVMRGTGAVIAVSARLAWDPAVVEPVGHLAGDWLAAQGGQAFSAAPGMIDAAVLGGPGMTGEGVLATVTFRVLAAGDPKIRVESLEGRDGRNRVVDMTQSLRPQAPVAPATTQLALARPNPFRDIVTIPFSLSARGPVALELYSVDGRRVRTLVNETREAGEYDVTWDGRDDRGHDVMAGVYYLRMVTAQGRFTRRITNLR